MINLCLVMIVGGHTYASLAPSHLLYKAIELPLRGVFRPEDTWVLYFQPFLDR